MKENDQIALAIAQIAATLLAGDFCNTETEAINAAWRLYAMAYDQLSEKAP